MKKLLMAAAAAATASTAAFGAGFGIYEASARGNAVGGALVGDAGDATANYYNPANIAFATNIQFAAGMTFINPYCDVEVDHVSQDRMNPGWFTVPNAYLVVPLPWDFAFGWGNYTEFGLGTHYSGGWDLAADTQATTMEQITLNPNLAYKVLDNLSVCAPAGLNSTTTRNLTTARASSTNTRPGNSLTPASATPTTCIPSSKATTGRWAGTRR